MFGFVQLALSQTHAILGPLVSALATVLAVRTSVVTGYSSICAIFLR